MLRLQYCYIYVFLIKTCCVFQCSSSTRCTWSGCWPTLSWISAPPTGSESSWEPSCWPPKSGMTRLCGMSTTARSLKTSLWRTCELLFWVWVVAGCYNASFKLASGEQERSSSLRLSNNAGFWLHCSRRRDPPFSQEHKYEFSRFFIKISFMCEWLENIKGAESPVDLRGLMHLSAVVLLRGARWWHLDAVKAVIRVCTCTTS